ALALAGGLAFPGVARAGGITVPRVGGLNFSSPVEGTHGAFWWNPAALGLMDGLQISLDANITYAIGSYERTIDPNGDPAAAGRYPVEKFHAIAPGPLLGVSYRYGRVAFGVGVLVPFGRDVDYPGTEEAKTSDAASLTDALSPGRYHLVHTDFKHFYLSPGVAVEIVRDTLWVGATFNVMYGQFATWLAVDQGTSEDVTLQAISRIGAKCAGSLDMDSVCTPGADGTLTKEHPLTSLDFGFTAGLLLKPTDAFKLGASLSSGTKSHFEGRGLFTIPSALGGTTYEADVDLTYNLPWTFNVGAEYKLKRKLEIDVWYTFQNYQVHDDFLICVGAANGIEGTTDANARCADDAADNDPVAFGLLNKATVRYRGYKASHALAVGVAYPVVADMLKVGLNVMYENSSVPKSAITLASVDGKKIDVLLAAQLTPAPWLAVNLGLSYIWGPTTDNTGESDFRRSSIGCDPKNPTAAPVCGTEEFGPGDGIYKLGVFRAGIGVAVKFFQPAVTKKVDFYMPPTVTPSGESAPASAPSTTTGPAASSAPAPTTKPAP
ncbi:MAG TPA: outer membrane protein transport protein, partial [Myxococcota bacterium]|nr:outer membrane protein transport protein [Myxococcota bacterium]